MTWSLAPWDTSVVSRTTALASPGNWSERQDLGPHPRPTESESAQALVPQVTAVRTEVWELCTPGRTPREPCAAWQKNTVDYHVTVTTLIALWPGVKHLRSVCKVLKNGTLRGEWTWPECKRSCKKKNLFPWTLLFIWWRKKGFFCFYVRKKPSPVA